MAAIGFSVTPDSWGMGYASELARFALSFSFDQLHVHRVTASVAVENPASCRVLEKAGMVREGTSRQCIEARGQW
ncbi:MAG: GNAT family protein [Pseudomonadota bacterium]